jgi:CspA family cold shock protein
MPQGKVNWFSPVKGFGFVKPDNGDKNVFVRISAVERYGLGNLTDGQAVGFDIARERGRASAANLKTVESRLHSSGTAGGSARSETGRFRRWLERAWWAQPIPASCHRRPEGPVAAHRPTGLLATLAHHPAGLPTLLRSAASWSRLSLRRAIFFPVVMSFSVRGWMVVLQLHPNLARRRHSHAGLGCL